MKFELDRESLLKAVATAGKTVAQKGVKPILANILIEAENDKVKFVGSDGDVMSIAETAADVSKPGKVTAPARLLSELISTLATDSLFPVSVELVGDSLKFEAGKSRFEIRTLDAEDFPPVPTIDTEFMQIDSKEILTALKQVFIAAGGDGNPVQQSVFFGFAEMPVFAATDSKRLAFKELPEMKVSEGMKAPFIVPVKAAKEFIALLNDADDASLGVFKGSLVLKTDKCVFLSRLIDGKWPDYKRVVPKESSIEAKFYRKEFLSAIKSMIPIARDRSNMVKFAFKNDSVSIFAESPDKGKAQTEIKCEKSGEDIEIAFNAQFIQDFLLTNDCEEITLQMTNSSYPGLFVSGNETPSKYVVMPISG